MYWPSPQDALKPQESAQLGPASTPVLNLHGKSPGSTYLHESEALEERPSADEKTWGTSVLYNTKWTEN